MWRYINRLVARWCVRGGGGGGGGGAKHVISGLNQWCSQDNTCSNARTACMYETKCGYKVFLFPIYCMLGKGSYRLV